MIPPTSFPFLRWPLFWSLALASATAEPSIPVFQIPADLPTLATQSQSLGPLQDTTIDESSGLALSLQNPGLYWTHNDSGGKPILYAIDEQGRTVATLHIDGARNIDWEDLASGPNDQGQPTLFIADIGDNLRRRDLVQVYEVPEPKLPRTTSPESIALSAKPSRIWQLRYPNEAADAESLVVHPKTGLLHLITKSLIGQSTVYAFPATASATTGITELRAIAQLTFPPLPTSDKRSPFNVMTTGASFSPDGRHLVISTYCSLYEWAVATHGLSAATFEKPPRRLQPPNLRQLEAICYGPDSNTLLLTSEQVPAAFIKLTRPTR
jgi:hypothetical protein